MVRMFCNNPLFCFLAEWDKGYFRKGAIKEDQGELEAVSAGLVHALFL